MVTSKKAFQSDKSLACTKKSVISATSLKLIKMMLKCRERKPYPHARLLESDNAILMCILHFLALCRGPKWGAWHNTPTLNTSLDVRVLMVTAY